MSTFFLLDLEIPLFRLCPLHFFPIDALDLDSVEDARLTLGTGSEDECMCDFRGCCGQIVFGGVNMGPSWFFSGFITCELVTKP